MRLAKWLFGAVALAASALLLGGLLLPSTFSVSRSVVVAAPAEKVYALVVDPREWKRWTVWSRRDPQMDLGYSGPASGVGAGWAWKSASEGDGRMSFTAAEPNRRLDYELFFPDFDTPSRGVLLLEPVAGGTQVRWTMHGDMGRNPVMRWFALFADGMVGTDFEGGLANLKALAEGA